MKILAIRGKNLASLEGEFNIDFTVEPLKSAGIFAITGSTGSGKSTLLDAMCLALFNDTPRMNRALDNADIVDVDGLTIKQKDSRNILRRGTWDGYAEIDFIALSGDKYRANWSVRRSRNKAKGALQSANYKVFNLSTNCELQGGKTELLQRVRQLIGLNFDQFTRAVLLAQGDFATFLKAAPKEKAELLEKLTGTDIYSKVSSKIYENTKQAEAQLSLITERIKDVELLSEERITSLTTERESVANELELFDIQYNILSEKLKWIQTNNLLYTSVVAAQNEFEKSKVAIEQAKDRFNYLARVESVRHIRDNYKQLLNDKKLLISTKVSLSEQHNLRVLNNEALNKAKDNFLLIENYQKQILSEQQSIAPQIKEARRLDVKIEGLAKIFTDIDKDFSGTKQLKDSCQKNLLITQEKIQIIRQSISVLAKWFDDNNYFSTLIPRIELIVSYITDAQFTYKQEYRNKELLTKINDALTKEKQNLVAAQTEAKRLNDILPAEIAVLREKLKENEPCPVCGSIHHPISAVNVESLEQKKLNIAKNNIAQEIERLTASINGRKEEIIRLQSLINEYSEQHSAVYAKLSESMGSYANWRDKYEKETLSEELKKLAAAWNKNLTDKTHISEQLIMTEQDINNLQTRLLDLNTTIKDKQDKLYSVKAELDILIRERRKVLDGKSADDIERMYSNKQQSVALKFKQASELQNSLIAKGENLEGAIAQLLENDARLTNSVNLLEKAVLSSLNEREDKLSIEGLDALLSKDNNWLNYEREALDSLKRGELSAKTTLIERQRVANEHQKAQLKPSEQESEDFIINAINEKTIVINNSRKRIAEIDTLFANHQKGKAKIEQFKNDLAQKSANTENWRKLNELFGSADGAKFKVLAQGYTLDVLLGYANKHLKDISDRYLLERVSPDSLSLQVVDLDMLSELRSVHSLSGGESFLISLSLALGLSSLSSNRMSIESLFIDEGFGSLDADTLRVAMDALERLQMQGRKIGVISHVAEMTERIPTQIRVIKTTNGRSRVEVVASNCPLIN